MLESINDVFSRRKKDEWQPMEIKVVAEQYLQQYLKTDKVYCVDVNKNRITIRVGSPTVYQEARLNQWDITQALAQEVGYTLNSLKIIPTYY